ncbi:MAG: hypothetical protein VX589_17710 [Myxococcota bacterium]|nr:hypothetical protein [Myxococcota bacterium]
MLISDLHLGEACKEHSRIEYLKRSTKLDESIVTFLDHFTHHRVKARPWRLILGGDLLDFLQVTTVPANASPEDVRYGLGTKMSDSVWKLQALMERHRRFFVYLAGFVGAGHRVEIIRGNHDEELFWPEVQNALVEGLARIYFGQESASPEARKAFTERIHFSEWFFYEPGLIYIEHGHRFDEYCVTPPQLCPLRPESDDELVLPLSALAIRYFANLEPGFQTHDKEHWGPIDYVRHFKRKGWLHLISLFARHLDFALRSIRYYWDHGRHESATAQKEKEEAFTELARSSGLNKSQLRSLDALSAPSVMSNLPALFANLGLGETLTILTAAMLVPLSLATDWPVFAELAGISAFAAAGFYLSGRNRARFSRDIRGKLRQAAETISTIVDAPVVCFGHCHAPVVERLSHDHRSFYANTGNFLAAVDDDDPAGHSVVNSYIILERPSPDEFPTPVLHRWRGSTGGPTVDEHQPLSLDESQ